MTASNDPSTGHLPGEPAVGPVPGRADARAIEFSVHGLSKRLPEYSAHKRFSLGQRIGIGTAIVGVVVAFVLQPIVAGTVVMALLTILYVGMLGLRIELAIRGRGDQRVKFTDDELASLDRSRLPTFSILVPAYKEPVFLPNLVANLTALDYPKDRLEIKLLLEEDDVETIEAAVALHLEDPFEVVIVPHVGPRTKPKALNYALHGLHGRVRVHLRRRGLPGAEAVAEGGGDVRAARRTSGLRAGGARVLQREREPDHALVRRRVPNVVHAVPAGSLSLERSDSAGRHLQPHASRTADHSSVRGIPTT